MDQKINRPLRSITSNILLVVLAFSLFVACKKEEQEPRHKDVFEAELNGVKYKLSIVNNSGTPGQNLFLQGRFEDSQYLGSLRLDFCNLQNWPNQKSFPIFRDSCDYFDIGVTASTVSFVPKNNGPSFAYTVQSLTPDGYSEVVFEEFRGTSDIDYELKGTFKMRLPGDGLNPQNAPDSCLVTGRFHLKRPLVNPKK